jgi:ribosome modulation factor
LTSNVIRNEAPNGLESSLSTNPYDAETQPRLRAAYQDGWDARQNNAPHKACPHSVETATRRHRAWINGWQAAHLLRAQQSRTE